MAGRLLQRLDQRNDQPALGNHGHYHPFQQFEFGSLNVGLDRLDVDLDCQNIDLGGQIAVEQLDLLFRKGLGLLFRKAAFRQIFDKLVRVKGDCFIHAGIVIREPTKCNARQHSATVGDPY